MKKCPYWQLVPATRTKQTQTFQELGTLAVEVLGKFPPNVHGKILQVCGPVSTGGFKSTKTNFLVLADAVRLLRERGDFVFDQTHLEEVIVGLWKRWKADPAHVGYCWPILDDVYRPIFESGLVGTLLFLPGWECSTGACWERSIGHSLGIKVAPYPEDLYVSILASHSLARS